MLLYGRGVKSIADQIKSHEGKTTKDDVQEAKDLTKEFFANYPLGEKWINDTHDLARKQEYVEDLWGRRRRLPDINLPPYEFKLLKPKQLHRFNPLLNSTAYDDSVPSAIQKKYIDKFSRCMSAEDRIVVEEEAREEGIIAVDNNGRIAQAERQSVNARIQGGAATMTKIAMNSIYRDPIMKELGFHLLIPVHDELIGECPLVYVKEAKVRLSELMVAAGSPECDVPMKCDADAFPSWYYDVMSAHVREEYEEQMDKGIAKDIALKVVKNKNKEFTDNQICEMLGDMLNEN